jgi:hypothetical protein
LEVIRMQPMRMQPTRIQPTRIQPWIALWAIKDIPDDGFEVIRDGRPVGIARCDDFEEAVREILRHRLYRGRDQVVRRDRDEEWDVDVTDYRPEQVGV